MRLTTTIGTSLLALALAGALGAARSLAGTAEQDAATQDTGASAATTFEVDPVHSSMAFKIRHLGVANFIGRFNRLSGSYSFDPDDPTAGHFDIRIAADSIDTNSEGRDKHLKGPDFFNVQEHPEIRFQSTAVKKTSKDTWTVTGQLSLMGQSRPLTAEMTLIGVGETFQGYKSGFDTTFTFKRTDYGMDTYVEQGALGDEVEVMLCLEGRRK